MSFHIGYAQARIQARYALLPNESLWLHMGALNELASFIEAARSTSIAHWVKGLSVTNTATEIENSIRRTMDTTISETASWFSPAWQPAFAWLSTLSDLPELQYVSRKSLPAEGRVSDLLMAKLSDSDYEDDELLDLLVAIWRSTWPKVSRENSQGLETLLEMLVQHRRIFPTLTAEPSWAARQELETRLRFFFRRHILQPSMAFTYLSLVALSLERLQAELLHRALFDGQAKAAA